MPTRVLVVVRHVPKAAATVAADVAKAKGESNTKLDDLDC